MVMNMLPKELAFVGNLVSGTIDQKQDAVIKLAKGLHHKLRQSISKYVGDEHSNWFILIVPNENTFYVNAITVDDQNSIKIICSMSMEQLAGEMKESDFKVDQSNG